MNEEMNEERIDEWIDAETIKIKCLKNHTAFIKFVGKEFRIMLVHNNTMRATLSMGYPTIEKAEKDLSLYLDKLGSEEIVQRQTIWRVKW